MFKNIIKIALGLTLIAGSATAQQRYVTDIAVQSANPGYGGIVADVSGSNFNGFSLVGLECRVGTYSFGSGTIVSVDEGSREPVSYTDGTFWFVTLPYYTWYQWCQGYGDVAFYM